MPVPMTPVPVDFDPTTTPFTPVLDAALSGASPVNPAEPSKTPVLDQALTPAPIATPTTPASGPTVVDFDPTTTPFTPAPEPKKAVIFDPTKQAHDKVFSVADFKALPLDQLDNEKQFEPTDFGFQHEDELNADPEAKAKLLELYKLRNQPFHQTRKFLAQPAGDIAKQTLLAGVHAPGKLIGGAWHVGGDIVKGLWNAALNASGAIGATGLAGLQAVTGASPQKVNETLGMAGSMGSELLSGFEAQSTSEAGLGRRSLRAVGEGVAALDPTGAVKDITGLKSFSELSPEELKARFDSDVQEKRAVQDAVKGTGEMVRAIAGSEEELKQAGITIDTAKVEKLMPATSLLNFIPLGEGLAVGAVGKVGGRFVVEKVAQATTPQQASLFIRAVNQGAELAGKAAKAGGEALETAGGKLRENVFKPLHNLGDVSAVLAGSGGHLGVGAGIAAVTKLTPKALELTGRAVQKAAPFVATGARIAADSAIEAGKGYAHGLLYTLPFMVGATPTEQEGLLNVAGLAGAVRGGVRATGLTGQVVGFKAQEALAKKIFEHVEQKEPPAVPDYGTDIYLDAQSRVNAANLPKAQSNLLGWAKHMFKDSGVEWHPVTDAQMIQQTGGQSGRGFAVKLGQTIAPDGSTKPLVRIFLNGDVEALPHEMLHALGNIDAPGYSDFVKTVNDSLTTRERQTFEQIYNTVQNGGLPEAQWKTRLSPEKVNEEVAAEIFSRVILGQDLSGVKPTLARKAALFTSNLLEKMGIPLGDVNVMQAKDFNPKADRPGFSTLGVRPTADATIISQNFIKGLLNHLENNGDLLPNFQRPSLLKGGAVTGGTSLIKPRPRTPAPTPGAPAAPAAPANPATPAAPATPSAGPSTPTTPTPLPTGPTPSPKPRNIRTTEAKQNDFAAQRAEVTNVDKATDAAAKSADANTVKHVADISKVLESGKGVVELEYLSVKDTGNANAPTTRTPRRDAQEAAYIAEGMGAAPADVRDLAQKVTVPVRWEVQGGKPQLIAMSLDKVVANVAQTVKDVVASKVEGKIPYEIKDGALTDAAWHDVVSDLQDYAENQSNGFRGDGQKLTRPTEDIGASIPAENPAYSPRILSEQKANFLNYIQGLNPPLTAREVKGVTPGNVKGQIIAEVNKRTPEKPAVIRPKDIQKQTFKSGREIRETNPLRNELAAAGVDPRKLIEVTERIDPSLIAKVTPRPDLNFKAPVTDTIRGGFLPGGKEFFKHNTVDEIGEAVSKASPEEWQKLSSEIGSLTTGAYQLGVNLKDVADVAKLRALETKFTEAYQAAKGEKDFDAMMLAATKKQFVTEALETATGMSPGKRETIARQLGPDWQPPFPEAAKPEGQLLPKTESAQKLSTEGFDFRISGQPGVRAVTVLKDGVAVGEFQSAQRAPGTAEISNVLLKKEARGTGAAEAAYRELLAQLQADGVTKVEGTVVAPQPLAIRRKIFGGFDKLELNGEPVSIDDALHAANEIATSRARDITNIEAVNEIPVDKQFLPGGKDELNGLAFKEFFSKVSKGEFGKSKVPWVPVTNVEKQKDFLQAVQEHSGNFDEHIAKSIPTYRETQLRKGTAIIALAGDGDLAVLDIGGSEGSWDKAVTQLSGGKVTTVTVDPNPAMSDFFHEKSKVPGAQHVTAAFREGFEDEGKHIPAFDSTKKFDVVNESMTFQFINPDRAGQVAEVKRLLAPDGLFITDEKLRDPKWAENEAKKDKDFKSVYFSDEELKAKDKVVGFQQAKQETKTVGMIDNMVTPEQYEQILRDHFKFVSQYWDSGNFKGYVASDDLLKLQKFLREVGDTSSEFSTQKTPRAVPNVREQGENSLLTQQRLLAGQLLPKQREPLSPEDVQRKAIKSPAVRLDNGRVIEGPIHAMAIAKALDEAPNYEGKFKSGFTTNEGEFLDSKKALLRAEDIKQVQKGKGLAQSLGFLESKEFEKNRNFLPGSTGWILPNQKFVPLAQSYHERYLADESKALNKKFGTKFSATADINERLKALNDGFVRIRGGFNGGGSMNIELNAKFFTGKTRKAVENFLEDHADDIDNLNISLLNDKGQIVDSTSAKVFEFDGPERVNALLEAVDGLRARPGRTHGGQLLPGGDEILPGLNIPSEERAQQLRVKARVAKSKEKFPEAIKLQYAKDDAGNFVLGEDGKPKPQTVEYGFMNTPLAREAAKNLKGEDRIRAVEQALGRKLVTEAKDALKRPDLQAGAKWYSTARTRLKGLFGEDTKFFTELLGATSARTPVETNYRFALDAYNQFKQGKFDDLIRKYREGKSNWDAGNIKDFLAATGNQNPTRGQYLDWWVQTNDISPVQSNGKKFGANSRQVLKVLDGSWAEEIGGPKTPNFAGNLAGTTFEATIDVWAARMLHRLANEGNTKPWRILAENETGVVDEDFAIGQAAYRHAAKELGMKPDALQAVLWFAEKDYWEKKGWTRGAGAEKSDFNVLLKETEPASGGTMKMKSAQNDLFSVKSLEIKKRK
jgi:SAM-dependent methyltransferase